MFYFSVSINVEEIFVNVGIPPFNYIISEILAPPGTYRISFEVDQPATNYGNLTFALIDPVNTSGVSQENIYIENDGEYDFETSFTHEEISKLK